MRRGFRRRPAPGALVLSLIFAAVFFRFSWYWLASGPGAQGGGAADANRRPAVFTAGSCDVTRVLSGNSLQIRQRESRPAGKSRWIEGELQLLGIRLPALTKSSDDKERLAAAAKQFAETFVADGRVELALDKRRLASDGAFLAYVVVDDRMLNVELVRQGLAQADSRPGDSATVARQLRRAEDEARREKRGIWQAAAAENRSSGNLP